MGKKDKKNKKPKPKKKGGRRKGSGRPKFTEPTRKISLLLPEKVSVWCESQGKLSEVVRGIVQQAYDAATK
jgi:hypothetical protein